MTIGGASVGQLRVELSSQAKLICNLLKQSRMYNIISRGGVKLSECAIKGSGSSVIRLVAYVALVSYLISSSTTTTAGADILSAQQLATNQHAKQQQHYKQHQHEHHHQTLPHNNQQDPSNVANYEGRPQQQTVTEAEAAAAAGSRRGNCLRVSSSDKFICVPYENRENPTTATTTDHSQQPSASSAIENFLESIVDLRQRRTDNLIDPQEAAAAAAAAAVGDWILEINSKQDNKQKDQSRAAAADIDEVDEQNNSNDNDDDYSGSSNNNDNGYHKANELQQQQQRQRDLCSVFERHSLVWQTCRRQMGLAAKLNRAATGSNLLPPAQAPSADTNRHELSTRSWRASQQQQQHTFRMTTDEARQLLDSLEAKDVTPPALVQPSSSFATATAPDRSPVMSSFRMGGGDIRNQRRSDSDGPHFWPAAVAAATTPLRRLRFRRPVSSNLVLTAGSTRSHRSGIANETSQSGATSTSATTSTTSTTTTTGQLETTAAAAANLALIGKSGEPMQPLTSGGSSGGGGVDVDGGQLVAAAATAAASGREDSPLECTSRRYTFRAVKTDSAGNKCSGFVTASICYGGCDTGEIADWLFPHKKSIHKVCTHGQRIKRRALLQECTSNEVEPSLREYHFVDALNCVCQRCQSADTTCLGSLTRPNLPAVLANASAALAY